MLAYVLDSKKFTSLAEVTTDPGWVEVLREVQKNLEGTDDAFDVYGANLTFHADGMKEQFQFTDSCRI